MLCEEDVGTGKSETIFSTSIFYFLFLEEILCNFLFCIASNE